MRIGSWRPPWWRGAAPAGAGPAAGPAAGPVADGEGGAAAGAVGWRRWSRPGSWTGRPGRVAVVLVPVAVYVALGMLRLAPVWAAPTRLTQCGCGDAGFTMWYLGWTQYALAHGHNPLFTDWLFYPSGVNVMWNVSLPLPGFLLSPLTAVWGTILSYNVLIVVAFAGTATSAYLVLRRWAPWPPAAFAGGLLYGFSPYMIGQGLGHAHMLLLLLIPVMLLLLDELLVRQRLRFWVAGPLLGLTIAAQLLTAEELLASAALVGAVGAIVLAALFPGQVRSRLPGALVGLALAAGTALVLCAVPLRYQLTGPQRLTGTVSSPDLYRADLLSWVVPSPLMHFAPPAARDLTDRFGGNVAENGSYLGIPLLVVAAAVVVLLWRRRPVVRWAGVTLLVVMVLASGRSLKVGGRDTGLPLPFRVVEHLPLLESLVSVRLASYAVLLCALLLAVGMDGLRAWVLAGRRAQPPERTRQPLAWVRSPRRRWQPPRWVQRSPAWVRRSAAWAGSAWLSLARAVRRAPASVWAGGLAGLLAVVALLPLLPTSYQYGAIGDAGVPAWFTSAAAQQRVPEGSVLITLPPASPATSAPMVWQSVARYHFKVPFGYSLHPGSEGRGQFGPYPSTFGGVMARVRRGPQPRVNAGTIREMRADLAGWQARTVVLRDQPDANVPEQVDLLTRVLGHPPRHDSGAWVWYDIDAAGLAGLPVEPPPWPPKPVRLPSG
jgi:hypothetical protein